MIGDKYGPVGVAFTNAISQLSVGAYASICDDKTKIFLLSLYLDCAEGRVRNMKDMEKMFGPAQHGIIEQQRLYIRSGVDEFMDEYSLELSLLLYSRENLCNLVVKKELNKSF